MNKILTCLIGLSYILSAPFYAVSWMLFAPAYAFCWVGNFIHDATTYRIWCVRHRRHCAEMFPARATKGAE